MISIFEGRIGGGKTYLAVTRILAHLAKGGTVVTNVELLPDGCACYLAKHYGLQMDPSAIRFLNEEETGFFHKHLIGGTKELPVLAVIDEAHLWFNARDTMQTGSTKRALLTFLSQSRKLGVDVIFIVQKEENLEAQFRRLASELWRMKDLSKLRIPGFGIQYPWPHIIAFRLDAANGLLMERKIIRRTHDVFDCYDTNALLRPVEFAGEIAGKRNLIAVEKKPFSLQVPQWLQVTGAVVAILAARVAFNG